MLRAQRRHAKRLRTAASLRQARESKEKRPRGEAGQKGLRQMERALQKAALACWHWARERGLGSERSAGLMGLSESTLRAWRKRWQQDRAKITLRGRPAEKVDLVTRMALVVIFQLMGPGVGLGTLRWLFPEASRAELEEMLKSYRKAARRKSRVMIHALRWIFPGTVWATDWTQPPKPVDGIYRYVLVVRDLATGMQLAALPSLTREASVTAGLLGVLFDLHGPPLVLKSDNEFDAHEISNVLKTHSVWHLLSPPALPAYNGACEAGIGSLKTEAYWEAARNDRPGEWTCDDVEGARMRANQTHKPNGFDEPSPEQAWRDRQPVSDQARSRLRQTVEALVPVAAEELQVQLLPGMENHDRQHYNAVNRLAISRALVALDILRIRRRRITPRITRKNKARIS